MSSSDTLQRVQIKKGSSLDQATAGAAGYDLAASEYAIIEPGQTKVIKTDVFLAVPKGNVGIVCSRSGLAAKKGVFVLNAPGIIDSDYRGEIMVILANFGETILTVAPGDRIAQLLIVPLALVQLQYVAELSETTRGEGGLGSTGV